MGTICNSWTNENWKDKVKNLLIILFIGVVQIVFGQDSNQDFALDSISYFVIIENDTIVGTYEELELSDCKFKQYRKQVYKKLNSRELRIEGATLPVYDCVTHYVPIIYGEYKNGEKYGKWIYWKDYGTEYSFCRQHLTEYEINYSEKTTSSSSK